VTVQSSVQLSTQDSANTANIRVTGCRRCGVCHNIGGKGHLAVCTGPCTSDYEHCPTKWREKHVGECLEATLKRKSEEMEQKTKVKEEKSEFKKIKEEVLKKTASSEEYNKFVAEDKARLRLLHPELIT